MDNKQQNIVAPQAPQAIGNGRTTAEIDAEIARLEAEREAINTCWVKCVYVEKSGSGSHCIRLPFAHLRGKSAEMHIREDAEIVHGAALRPAPDPSPVVKDALIKAIWDNIEQYKDADTETGSDAWIAANISNLLSGFAGGPTSECPDCGTEVPALESGNYWDHPAPTPDAEPVGKPDGYAYRYPDGYIRHNLGGEINCNKPIESIPYYYYRHPACATKVAEKKLHAGDCVKYLVREYHIDTAHQSERALRTYCHERNGVKYTVSVCRTADFEPNAPTGKPVAVAGKSIADELHHLAVLQEIQGNKTFGGALHRLAESIVTLPPPSDLDAEIADQTMYEIGTWNPSNKEQMILGVIAALIQAAAATEVEGEGK